ncbi:hypothetical protein PG275_09615 [Riemerella anatipestifer]|nr:hypothetical protein [Riemerella anatipestifer]
MNTITRKIQILIDDENQSVKEIYETLYSWQEIVFRGANLVSTHLFLQEQISQFFYFTEDFRINLSNKLGLGVLNTSKQNTTYQLLSSIYKGKIPTSILTSLNSQISSVFSKEKKDYFKGAKSLRNYKRNCPIPIETSKITRFEEIENSKDFIFTIYNITFKTYFGRDMSNNRAFFQKYLQGEYKLCNSSIKLEGKKIYLYAVFQFESKDISFTKGKELRAKLSPNVPILLEYKNKEVPVGNKEEFLYRRIAIQSSLRRLQINSKYNEGGKGRTSKLKALEKFKEKEKKYILGRVHKYSKEVIDFCLKNKIGKIIISSQEKELDIINKSVKEIENNNSLTPKEKRDLIKERYFLLRNWSYYGLLEKISYKAKIYGIEIEIEK